MEKTSYIGRKVKLIGDYLEYTGVSADEIGIVVDDDAKDPKNPLWKVNINGKIYQPWGINNKIYDPQCILLPEEVPCKTLEEAIKELRGTDKVIHCSTQEEWDQVIQYAVNNSMKEGQGNWKSYQSKSCIQIDSDGRQSYADRRYMRKENCEIITFKELLQSTTMNDKQTLQAQIEKMEQDILAMKKQVEAIDNPVYKVGDWVTITRKDKPTGNCNEWYDNQTGLPVNSTFCIKGVKDALSGVQWLCIDEAKDMCIESPLVRKATKDEIAKAQVTKLPIGNSGKEVTITSSGIMAFDGTRINTDDLNEVIGQMKRSLDDINSWTVTVESVKIGCCEGCTLEQLESIYSKYQELKA